MSGKNDFVWRFELGKTELTSEGTTDLKVRMVRQQIQNLLNLVFLFQDTKRLRPTSFSLIGDRRLYQIFEDEGNIKGLISEGRRKHVQGKGTKCEEDKCQADS